MAGATAAGRVRASSSGGGGKRAGGRYVLGELLGRGGMAEVFAGYVLGDHGFQKPVAIKRLVPELAVDLGFVDRLIEEAKLLVGMQHGNIVSVLDLARDGDDVFLVMEFVDGPSLRQLIKARGKRGISPAIATYIVAQASQGLEFAHSRPGGAIVHADISPSNLLLTTSGEVRVADFGIARREGGERGVVEGKWAYMAPEQARGEALDPRSDVFAMGVVLYELLTGVHPFGRHITHEERDSEPLQVIPPRVLKPALPVGLDAICMRALAHDRHDRYPSMQALMDALTEERFTNQYREGASDLAASIRECNPATASQAAGNPRTLITDCPVTIMTRSLILEKPPLRRATAPAVDAPVRGSSRPAPATLDDEDEPLSVFAQSQSEGDDFAPSHLSGARTTTIDLEAVSSVAATIDAAPARPAGTPTAEQQQQRVTRAASALPLQGSPALRRDGPKVPQWLPPRPPEHRKRAPVAKPAQAPAIVRVAPKDHRTLLSILMAVVVLGIAIIVALRLMPTDDVITIVPSDPGIGTMTRTGMPTPPIGAVCAATPSLCDPATGMPYAQGSGALSIQPPSPVPPP